MPAFLVVSGVEQRAGIVECGASLQCKNCEVVGTSSLILTFQLHVSKVSIVLDDEILNCITFRNDELENLIGGLSWLAVDFVCVHACSDKGHTTEHANHQEIVVSAQKTGLILQILVLRQFLLIVKVSEILLESFVLELVEEEVGIADTTPAFCPC